MPLLPGLHYNGISYFSKKTLRQPRQNCLFGKGFDTRPVNTAHASYRSKDSASDDSTYEPLYLNTNERANFLCCRPD
jgi:hypothetical protein